MRIAALALGLLLTLTSAYAQTPASAARDGLGAFIAACVETNADRAAAQAHVSQAGWTPATLAELPRTRRGPQDNPLTHITEAPPADSLVYSARTADDALVVLHISTGARGAPHCALYVLGVDERQLAAALYPTDRALQNAFLATPLAHLSAAGRSFVATVSHVSVEGQYAAYQKMGYFKIEGR